MSDSYAEEYQEIFDKFIYENNLDLDDKYWAVEQRKEWDQIYSSLQQRWKRDPIA